jgi:hypothetical protein
MHIKAPHGASFLPGLLYGTFSLQTHESRPSQNSPQLARQHPLKKAALASDLLIQQQFASAKSLGTGSVNVPWRKGRSRGEDMRTRTYDEIQVNARALPAANIDLGSKLKGKQRESGGPLLLPLGGG